MTIKDKIAELGASSDLPPDAYLARALNRHGVAGMAERLNYSRTTVHQVCADLNIRWVYLSVPPDCVIIVHPKAGDAYQTDGRLAKEDPPPTDTMAGSVPSDISALPAIRPRGIRHNIRTETTASHCGHNP